MLTVKKQICWHPKTATDLDRLQIYKYSHELEIQFCVNGTQNTELLQFRCEERSSICAVWEHQVWLSIDR